MGLLDSTARNVRAVPGAPALAALRERVLNGLAARGLPQMRDEDWKYTDLTVLDSLDYHATQDAKAPATLPLSTLAAHRLVFIDGRFSATQSSKLDEISGVRVELLADLAREDPTALATRLGVQADSTKLFTALNAATANDGIYLSLARDTALELPLLLIFVTTPTSLPRYHAPLVHCMIGRHSRATLIEVHTGGGETAYVNNAFTQITTEAGADVIHYRVVDEATAGTHIGRVALEIGPDSHIQNFSLALNGKLVRVDVDCVLSAPGGEVTLNGVFMAGQDQHIDHHTRVDHRASHTRSLEVYKGIASGNGRGVFNGKVIVHAGTEKVVAEQSSNNLLLSHDAEIDTKPELELYTDDLRCAHGATVGQLDEHALFYLRARGVPELQARALLTYGFVQALVETIEVPELRALVAQRFAVEHPDLAALLHENTQENLA